MPSPPTIGQTVHYFTSPDPTHPLSRMVGAEVVTAAGLILDLFIKDPVGGLHLKATVPYSETPLPNTWAPLP